MSWVQLKILTDAKYVDAIGDILTANDAVAVTLNDAADQPIFEPELETTPLWQQTSVIGLFANDTDIEKIILAIREQVGSDTIADYQLETVSDKDWVRETLKYFQPLKYGNRLWICPSWESIPDNQGVVVTLDPGLAFGTGTHPTTALCLEWLDANIVPGVSVIDYGCGSGILAIAALKLGAKQVWAIDNDPQALQATQENGERNELTEPTLIVATPQQLPAWQADILIANILAQPLVELADKFASLVKPHGKLALSGVLHDQVEQVAQAYQKRFELINVAYQENWARLEAIRKSPVA